jgi:hypothetical protein
LSLLQISSDKQNLLIAVFRDPGSVAHRVGESSISIRIILQTKGAGLSIAEQISIPSWLKKTLKNPKKPLKKPEKRQEPTAVSSYLTPQSLHSLL